MMDPHPTFKEAILFMQKRQKAVLETEDYKRKQKQTIICDGKKKQTQKYIYIYECMEDVPSHGNNSQWS